MILKVENVQGHGSRRLPWHTFTMLLTAIGLFVFGGPASEGLVFDRQAILHGELWRFLTGHWVHGDMAHLAWNLAAFGILGSMVEISLGQKWLYRSLIAGMGWVNAWVWLFIPSLDFYCGLSGILNTLLIVILIDGWRKTRYLIFPLVFIGAVAKITIELVQSSAVFTHTLWPAIPEAHLAGALAGVILMFYPNIMRIRLKLSRRLRFKRETADKLGAIKQEYKMTRINTGNDFI